MNGFYTDTMAGTMRKYGIYIQLGTGNDSFIDIENELKLTTHIAPFDELSDNCSVCLTI